ncbi:hypothetical protein [Streptomyces sp. NPDC007984]|uniref:hypothetical protein n=1 Tax=Streptomyces sp. NPDC007984 TaxID=3364801 RepID=UPI0036E27058
MASKVGAAGSDERKRVREAAGDAVVRASRAGAALRKPGGIEPHGEGGSLIRRAR